MLERDLVGENLPFKDQIFNRNIISVFLYDEKAEVLAIKAEPLSVNSVLLGT